MKEKKILYISFENYEDDSSGVNKKINGQIKAFRDKGYHVDLLSVYGKNVAFFCEGEKKLIMSRTIPRITLCSWAGKNCSIYDYDFAYIRFQFFCPFVLYMLKSLYNLRIKIVMEIPTYPYVSELKSQGVRGVPKRIIDSAFGKKCSKYISVFAAPLFKGIINGRKCVEIYNGIDIDNVSAKKTMNDNRQIDLLGVAMMAPWHGYERMINGIHDYYVNGGDRNIVLHLVGEGISTPEYERLIEQYELQRHVILHGKLSGDKLDEMYNIADIGVGSLATFTRNIYKTNTLKVLEYMAKGLPVICEKGEVGIPNDSDYRLTVNSGYEPINVEEIVKFYDSIYIKDNDLIVSDIRNYCQKNCSHSIGLRNVFDFFGNNNQ